MGDGKLLWQASFPGNPAGLTEAAGWYPVRVVRCRRFVASAVAVSMLAVVPLMAFGDEGDVEYVAIKAGRVITVAGEEFSPGTVVIEDGKISAVGGAKLEFPPEAKVIEAPDETVMPGLILSRSRFGLTNYKRSGVHGDLKASGDVYLSQIDFDPLLEAGFTTVCYIPAGSDIPGVASVYRTAGPEESRKVTDSAYLLVGGGKDPAGKTLRAALKKAKEEIEKVEKARKEWEKKQEAKRKEKGKKDTEGDKPEEEKEEQEGDDNGDGKRYGSGDDNGDDNGDEAKDKKKPSDKEKKEEEEKFKPPPIDPKYQPLVDMIQKKEGARMMVQLSRASDLHHLDAALEPYDELPYSLYLLGRRQTDYHHVVDLLGERKAHVVLQPRIHHLPQTTIRYNLADKLTDAGCNVAVIPPYDSRAEFLRLRQRLAELIRAGLSREAAMKSLTLSAAESIGLGDRLGSIEKDKDADLTFFDGDPLDPFAEVTRVMILGEIVWTAEDRR